MASCEQHRLCTIIGGACSLATHRSRGCRPNVTSSELRPGVLEEVRELLAVIDPSTPSDAVRVAAVRLAALVRREALDNRNLVALVADEEPELAPALRHLCLREQTRDG